MQKISKPRVMGLMLNLKILIPPVSWPVTPFRLALNTLFCWVIEKEKSQTTPNMPIPPIKSVSMKLKLMNVETMKRKINSVTIVKRTR